MFVVLFQSRWNSHKFKVRKYMGGETCLQEHLFEHFNSERHNGILHDASVTLINKTEGKNSIKREHF